jgi:hypothetical protein
MFQSIWTIFKEPTLVLAKVTLFQILPLKCSVKRFSVPWFRLCVYPVLCGVRLQSIWTETCRSKYTDVLTVNFEHFIWLINCAFVGQKNFDIIEMHGATIK